MNKRILIPTDFSKNALNATRYALDLYAKQNCDFYFLNVFHLDSYTTNTLILPEPGSLEYDSTKAASEESFAKLLDMLELHNDNPKHTFHTSSTLNYLSEAMKDIISKKDINLVVMGTKISYKRREMDYLIDIVTMHNAAIRVLYISKTDKLTRIQEENKQLLEDIFSTVECTFHTLKNIDVSQGITTFVASRNSDMIAFINKKHFFFGSVFSKPLVKEIGYNATTPILALH